jgi:hypothetical protein
MHCKEAGRGARGECDELQKHGLDRRNRGVAGFRWQFIKLALTRNKLKEFPTIFQKPLKFAKAGPLWKDKRYSVQFFSWCDDDV